MRYNQKLVEEVRQGKAQFQVDQDDKWNDLLNHIFPKRDFGYVQHIFYRKESTHVSGYQSYSKPFKDLPIIHASKFIEEEVKWVEVSNDKVYWEKRIFVADLGERFVSPILAVIEDDNDDYLNGKNEISTMWWKFMREIEEPKEESEINKVLNEILKEYQENGFKSIVRIIKSKMI